jgi:hypothetical protein
VQTNFGWESLLENWKNSERIRRRQEYNINPLKPSGNYMNHLL